MSAQNTSKPQTLNEALFEKECAHPNESKFLLEENSTTPGWRVSKSASKDFAEHEDVIHMLPGERLYLEQVQTNISDASVAMPNRRYEEDPRRIVYGSFFATTPKIELIPKGKSPYMLPPERSTKTCISVTVPKERWVAVLDDSQDVLFFIAGVKIKVRYPIDEGKKREVDSFGGAIALEVPRKLEIIKLVRQIPGLRVLGQLPGEYIPPIPRPHATPCCAPPPTKTVYVQVAKSYSVKRFARGLQKRRDVLKATPVWQSQRQGCSVFKPCALGALCCPPPQRKGGYAQCVETSTCTEGK